VVALLMLAAGFALGLFFGWLLHRERVERALYEDVARHRDRAKAALAETSARLELANKDLIRLRSQLTDLQQMLDERDSTIADLRARGAARPTRDDDRADSAEGTDRGPVDAAADAATTPSGVTRLDDADHTAVTQEVSLATSSSSRAEAAVDADIGDEHDHTIDVTPAARAGSVGATDGAAEERPAPDDVPDEEPAVPVGGEPSADVGPAEDEPADVEPAGDEASEGEGVAVEPVGDGASEGEVGALPADDHDLAEADADAERDEPEGGEIGASEGEVGALPADDHDLAEADADAERDEREGGEIGAPLVVEEPAVGAVSGGELDQPDVDAPPVVEESAEPATGTTAAPEPPAGHDDLQRIAGVGPALEVQLRAEGITTYRQLALLDDDAIADLQSRRPQLVTRMRRGGWAAQARRLHAETYDDPI
jgi:predicted flap endonuclease-1-like 5' DNA nuclease